VPDQPNDLVGLGQPNNTNWLGMPIDTNGPNDPDGLSGLDHLVGPSRANDPDEPS